MDCDVSICPPSMIGHSAYENPDVREIWKSAPLETNINIIILVLLYDNNTFIAIYIK